MKTLDETMDEAAAKAEPEQLRGLLRESERAIVMAEELDREADLLTFACDAVGLGGYLWGDFGSHTMNAARRARQVRDAVEETLLRKYTLLCENALISSEDDEYEEWYGKGYALAESGRQRERDEDAAYEKRQEHWKRLEEDKPDFDERHDERTKNALAEVMAR